MILALDPGTRNTGWCFYSSENDYECGTLRAGSFGEMKEAVIELLNGGWPNCDAQVAVEAFTFQGWRKTKDGKHRAITQGSKTAHLVGFIEGLCYGQFLGAYDAKDTKANMGWIRKQFRNEHEFSAYCVGRFAETIKEAS